MTRTAAHRCTWRCYGGYQHADPPQTETESTMQDQAAGHPVMKQIHPSTAAILKYFEHAHLAADLQPFSAPFRSLAYEMAQKLDGPELTAGLRKLLEAKDCFVRAALP